MKTIKNGYNLLIDTNEKPFIVPDNMFSDSKYILKQILQSLNNIIMSSFDCVKLTTVEDSKNLLFDFYFNEIFLKYLKKL